MVGSRGIGKLGSKRLIPIAYLDQNSTTPAALRHHGHWPARSKFRVLSNACPSERRMASIRQRNQKWQVRITRKGFPPVVKSFDSKREAQRWAVDTSKDASSHCRETSAASLLLTEVLERYAREVSPSKRGSTREQEGIRFMQRQKFALYAMSALSPSVIAQYRDERLKTVGPGTIIRELSILSSVINHAIREWEVPILNPCRMVRKPAAPRGRSRLLGKEEEQRLLDELAPINRRSPWMRPLVQLALETAMRRGELLELRWPDVDLSARTALLRQTKNGADRVVPLSSRAISVLMALARSTDSRVFPVSFAAMEAAFSKACARAGINDLHFHDLRHNATSRMAAKLPNVIELAAVTGHSTVQMLKRYYHPRPEELAKKLD